MNIANEILDAIEIIVDKKIRENTAQIYLGVCKSVSGNTCVMLINGKDNTVQFYGSTPAVGSIYRVFVPNGNMSMAFVITGANSGSGGSGGSSSGVTSYTKLTELPTINGVVLQEGATSKSLSLYGRGNEPNYPVTKVNGKTGEVTLTADDVNALPLNTVIPKKTSELTNDSGFITLTQIPDSPVQSVNGKTGAIVLTATDVKALPSSTTIPTKTSQLTNDSEFITLAQVPTAPVQSVNGQTGAVVIDEYSLPTASDTVLGGIKVGSGLTINSGGVLSATGGGVADAVEWSNVQSKPTTVSGYGITDAKIDNGVVILGDNRITPVTSVNGKTGDVTLGASDVGAVNKAGDTMTGDLTVGSASMQTNGYVTGTWLRTTANNALSKTPTKIAVLDDGWVYSRTPEQIKSDIGLSNVDNVKQYSANNPPPYPVTSVNGKTGDVTINVGGAGIGVDIIVQSSQPTNQKSGDFWYQIT